GAARAADRIRGAGPRAGRAGGHREPRRPARLVAPVRGRPARPVPGLRDHGVGRGRDHDLRGAGRPGLAADRRLHQSDHRRRARVRDRPAAGGSGGGHGVMAEQIGHLVQLADDFPHLTLQVLPFAAGAHAAAGSASLAILRFPDAPSLGVVYLEALSGGVYLESQEDVARYIRAFALLRAAALSAADSARLLSTYGSKGVGV